MRASVTLRLAMSLAAAAIVWLTPTAAASLCAIPIIAVYLAVDEADLLRTYLPPLLTLLATSSSLWFLVYLDFQHPDLVGPAKHLVEADAPFGFVIRIAVASLLLVLAVGASPDGRALALAKSFGLNDAAAILFAGSRALVPAIRDSFERSLLSLRAHGALGRSGVINLLRSVPTLVGMTWAACLDLTTCRAEVKWEQGGFLRPGAPALSARLRASRHHDFACAIALAVICVLVIGGRLLCR